MPLWGHLTVYRNSWRWVTQPRGGACGAAPAEEQQLAARIMPSLPRPASPSQPPATPRPRPQLVFNAQEQPLKCGYRRIPLGALPPNPRPHCRGARGEIPLQVSCPGFRFSGPWGVGGPTDPPWGVGGPKTPLPPPLGGCVGVSPKARRCPARFPRPTCPLLRRF